MLAREKRASAIATYEGLKNRKDDFAWTYSKRSKSWRKKTYLILQIYQKKTPLPDALEQEENLDAKKRQRDKLGSVNLRADEETSQHKKEIMKMQKDREDLVLLQ